MPQAETLRSGLSRVMGGDILVCSSPGDARSAQAFDGLAVLLTAETFHSIDVLLLVRGPRPFFRQRQALQSGPPRYCRWMMRCSAASHWCPC